MSIIRDRSSIKKAVANQREQGRTVGFVPTMGALHQGHLQVLEMALNHCDHVVVSIYVNPTQFNDPKDLEAYPRNLDRDLALLAPYGEKLSVFSPTSEVVYGDEIASIDYDFDGLDHVMEGRYRPGHFEGVATVLKHFFDLVQPDVAFFGEKDFQQLQIIKKLVAIEDIPVTIVGVPIQRADDGLALSSRNQRLSAPQLKAAPLLHKVLLQVQADFNQKSLEQIKEWVALQFKSNALLSLEYFEIAEADTLASATRIAEGKAYRAFLSVYAGDVRLIDNIALN